MFVCDPSKNCVAQKDGLHAERGNHTRVQPL